MGQLFLTLLLILPSIFLNMLILVFLGWSILDIFCWHSAQVDDLTHTHSAIFVSPLKPLRCVCMCVCACECIRFSCVWLFATQRTRARQAPLSMGFSRQEYWSGLPCPPPGDLANPGMEPASLTFPALAGGFLTTSATSGGRESY